MTRRKTTPQPASVRTIEDLRKDLDAMFVSVRSGATRAVKAREMNNTASKIMGTLKIELQGYAAWKMKPDIPYLGLKVGRKGRSGKTV